MTKNTTNQKPRKAPSSQFALTEAEAERIAEKLAASLDHDSDDIAMLLLLVNHFEHCREDFGKFTSVVSAVKRTLFVGTSAADLAREQFESHAIATRGNLLMWPNERAA